MVQQARAHATREAIILGAGKVFGDLSYAEATLSDVIKLAGVTQGALYFHFDSKLDLAQEVINQQHLISMAASEHFGSVKRPSIEALILLSAELARQVTSDPVVRGGLRLSTDSAQLFPEHASGPYLDWIASTKLFLRRAADEGSVKDSLDFSAMARFVISAFTGVQVVSRALAQWKDLPVRLDEMWKNLLPVLLVAPSDEEIARLAKLVKGSRT